MNIIEKFTFWFILPIYTIILINAFLIPPYDWVYFNIPTIIVAIMDFFLIYFSFRLYYELKITKKKFEEQSK